MITETDDVARALDDAATRWPEDRGNRRKLLLRLAAEGHQMARQEAERRRRDKLAAIDRSSGALTGIYEDGYLEKLREDWPE